MAKDKELSSEIKVGKEKNKKVLTLFIVLSVSLLLAMTAAITSFTVRIAFQIVLLFLQFVLLKNLLDTYYGED